MKKSIGKRDTKCLYSYLRILFSLSDGYSISQLVRKINVKIDFYGFGIKKERQPPLFLQFNPRRFAIGGAGDLFSSF